MFCIDLCIVYYLNGVVLFFFINKVIKEGVVYLLIVDGVVLYFILWVLEIDEVVEYVDYFCKVVCNVREVGFDGVEIYGVYGYLID